MKRGREARGLRRENFPNPINRIYAMKLHALQGTSTKLLESKRFFQTKVTQDTLYNPMLFRNPFRGKPLPSPSPGFGTGVCIAHPE